MAKLLDYKNNKSPGEGTGKRTQPGVRARAGAAARTADATWPLIVGRHGESSGVLRIVYYVFHLTNVGKYGSGRLSCFSCWLVGWMAGCCSCFPPFVFGLRLPADNKRHLLLLLPFAAVIVVAAAPWSLLPACCLLLLSPPVVVRA